MNACSPVLGFAALMAEGAEDSRRAQSAEIAARFQKVLGERLMSAMVADGPVAAIGVYRHEAPEVAARLSAETGAKVARRTALRVRNPDNAPDAGEWVVLKTFARDLKTGVKSSPEYFEVAADGSALPQGHSHPARLSELSWSGTRARGQGGHRSSLSQRPSHRFCGG